TQPTVDTIMAAAISGAPSRGKNCLQHCGGNAIGGRMLDRTQRQRKQVSHVGEEIERDHCACADSQSQRKIASWIFYLTGGNREVVPGVGSKKGARLRDA